MKKKAAVLVAAAAVLKLRLLRFDLGEGIVGKAWFLFGTLGWLFYFHRGGAGGSVLIGGWRLFLSYFVLAAPLPKAVDWLPVPSQQQIACTLVNTVVFLPVALRYGTRTLFRFQGTPNIFS